jgi:M6 family metalloprotease-like protein
MRGKRQDFVKCWFAAILVVMAVLSFNSFVLAVVANPTPYDVIQANGQKIKVVQKGDEWNNWIETMDGYSIEKNNHGWWVYSGTTHIKYDGLQVGLDNPTGLVKKHFRRMIREVPSSAKHLYRPDRISASSNNNTLVILAAFSDQTSVGTTAANWANKIFQDPNNSLADYYREISYGQFSIVPAAESHGTLNDGVIGWLTLSSNHPDTRGNLNNDKNRQAVKDAIQAADPHIDFSSFDSNGDGYISRTELSIIVITAGYESAYGTYTPSIWSHAWCLGWTVPAPTCDGVKIAEYMGAGDLRSGWYSMCGEWHQSSATNGHMATIGVIAHELGHAAFGLPDLYDLDISSNGIGTFGVMSYGNWGQKSTDIYTGTTPVHMCAWSKEFCGFVNPIQPASGSSSSIRKVSSYPDIYKLPTSDPNQYFLVENRQLTGYDQGLWSSLQTSQGGLAIWHIDMAKLNSGNNDNENHKLVDLEEAEGNCELDCLINTGDREDLFYQGNNTSFTDSTVPDSKLYNGTSTNVSITSISQSSSAMTANFSSPPQIVINRSNLYFGANNSGTTTSSQSLLIRKRGGGTLNWSVTSNQSWLSCTPSSGTNSGVVTVSVNPTGLAVGTYNGTITVSDSYASNSPQSVSVTLQVYKTGTTTSPFGTFATPINGSTVRSSIPVTGWVLDDIGIDNLKIYRNSTSSGTSSIPGLIYIGDAVLVEGARPDVEQAYPGYPMNYKAGWGYMLLTNFLPNGGNGTYTLYAIATDMEGHQVTLGTKAITCDNANAVKPFGAIDFPEQGGTASGSNYINWGWVLTPQPNYIATDGSTIKVWVDGVNIGNPVYNIYRSDIATLFPGYVNSNGAAGYFYLDTTTYCNGVHTIQWTATDSGGNADGIGSRYFTIQNSNPPPNCVSGAKSRNQNIFVPEIECWENLPIDRNIPVKIRKGFGKNIEAREIYHNEDDFIKIEIRELQRIELDFSDGMANDSQIFGYLAVGNEIYPLPIGTTLESKRGKFCWLPGPGFVGEYRFIFIEKRKNAEMSRKNIIVKILPKY